MKWKKFNLSVDKKEKDIDEKSSVSFFILAYHAKFRYLKKVNFVPILSLFFPAE